MGSLSLNDAEVEVVFGGIERHLHDRARDLHDLFERGAVEPSELEDARSWVDSMVLDFGVLEKLGIIGPASRVDTSAAAGPDLQ